MPSPGEPIRVPFKLVLERLLEPAGYRLVHIRGKLRVFAPPKVEGRTLRRIAFEVEEGSVDPQYVQRIIQVIDEDTKGRPPS